MYVNDSLSIKLLIFLIQVGSYNIIEVNEDEVLILSDILA